MTRDRPEKIGKYEVTGELGRGGMGVVYKGHDPVIRRDVALKVIRRRELDPIDADLVAARFKREAQAAGSLNHPNIVAIYEYGEEDDCAFIAMECVIGKSLRDHLAAGFRPELKQFPEILDQLLEGLEYSHARGVIHRDIKPGNLLISDMGVAKISDFGIAQLEASQLTLMGEVLGTPYYMAPEQFDAETVDERTDIYAAAVIVYEVLTGRRPFEGQGVALMKRILEDTPKLPSTLEPRLGQELDRVLLRALAKRPEERFRSARQFLEALHLAFERRPFTPTEPRAAESEITLPRRSTDDTPSGTARLRAANLGALRRGLAAAGTAAAPVSTAQDKSASSPPKARLLFVDDEERVTNALNAIFRDRYEVATASSGVQALELARGERYHAVVSDQRMPGMPGVELLREMKAIAPTTMRILLTGYSDLAAIVGSVNEGEVYRFVSKPWQQDDLQATIAEAVTIATALEASPPLRATITADQDVVALVLDDPAMARVVRAMTGDLCRVVHCAKLDEALQALATNEVGVLIADLESQSVDNTVLFRSLKQEHPETLVIVATSASDSELIISLINEARIFRFVNKPINLPLLQSHIVAALERYSAFKQSPALINAERARVSTARDADTSKSIVEKLRSITTRIASPFRG